MGLKKIFKYRDDSTNCQPFIYSIFKANNLMNEMIGEFVIQDAKSLVDSIPNIVTKFINGITDVSAFFDHLLYGAKLMDEMKIKK